MPSISDHQHIQPIHTCAKNIKKHHFINTLSVCRVLLLRFFCDLCGRSLWLIERIVARLAGSPFCFWQPPNPIPEKQWCSMTTRMPSNQQLKGISRKQNVRKYLNLNPEMVQVPQVDGKETPATLVYRLF
jgi:hypothetical protein